MISIDIKEFEPTMPYLRDMATGEWLVKLPDMATAQKVMRVIDGYCPQLVQQTNYKDVVAVALAFRTSHSEADLLRTIMEGLEGKSNPKAIMDEIRRQVGGKDV